jgi:hypothetical protein
VSLHAAKSQDMGFRESTTASSTIASGSDQGSVSYPESEEGNSTTNSTHKNVHDSKDTIKDVFYVVDRLTGQPFLDEELFELAESLLESLKTPMDVVLGGAMLGGSAKNNNSTTPGTNNNNTIQWVLQQQPTPPYLTRNEQISVVNSDGTIAA